MALIFLDRDGVINRFPGKGSYVTRQEDFHFLPCIFEAIKLLTEAGHEIFVISNQGCVSRGLITKKALELMTKNMTDEIRKHGGDIQKVYYCSHKESDLCDCKKPKTKLLLEAIGGRPLGMNEVYFIGDSEEDMQAAVNLGCRGVLLLSGRTSAGDLLHFPVKHETIKKDLYEAALWILQKKS